jgi:hypothetical protein
MRTALVALALWASIGPVDAGCARWARIAGQLVCIQSQSAQCVRWAQIAGQWMCVQSQ